MSGAPQGRVAPQTRAPPWLRISVSAVRSDIRAAVEREVLCRPGIGYLRHPLSDGSDEGNAYEVLFGLIFLSIFNVVGSVLRAEIEHRCDEISVHIGFEENSIINGLFR
jgi:hypothetical protein